MVRDDRGCVYAKICPWSLGFGFGVVSGLMMLIYAWIAWQTGMGVEHINSIGTIWRGYTPTLVGGLIGFVWGFIEGFLFGLISAAIYNLCIRCCGHCFRRNEPPVV